MRQKWTPQVFRCFPSNRFEFWFEILQIYLLKPSTFNCQVKFDSVEKRRSYRLFNMTAYRFFSIQKCSGYNTINNIVETTQLNNDQMPEFHCDCKCLKCLQSAPSYNLIWEIYLIALFEKPFTALSIGPCGRLPQITWSASLSLALVFSFVLSLQ